MAKRKRKRKPLTNQPTCDPAAIDHTMTDFHKHWSAKEAKNHGVMLAFVVGMLKGVMEWHGGKQGNGQSSSFCDSRMRTEFVLFCL